jgi:hypothetical protein
LKAAKREESNTRNNASARDAEKAEALDKKTAASTAVDAAKLELEQAEEDRSKAAEKPFEIYGSNLSQNKQASWEKIVTNLTIDAPHTDIFEKKHEEAGGKTKETSTIACRCTCSPGLSSMPRSCRNSTFCAVLRSLQGSPYISSTTTSTFSMTPSNGFL